MKDLGKIHHLAYVVDAIEPAAQKLNDQFGAGPFFYLDEVPVSDVTSQRRARRIRPRLGLRDLQRRPGRVDGDREHGPARRR